MTSLLCGESNEAGIKLSRETVSVDIGVYSEQSRYLLCVIGPSEDMMSFKVNNKSLVSSRICLQVDMMLRACKTLVPSCMGAQEDLTHLMPWWCVSTIS